MTRNRHNAVPAARSEPTDRNLTAKISDASDALRLKQLEVLDLFGKIDYDPGYDYKNDRKAPRRNA
jgi:hypothetical protein